ncbi:hypothetical protein HaLaN_05693, partial [Haematococcus lacustris]
MTRHKPSTWCDKLVSLKKSNRVVCHKISRQPAREVQGVQGVLMYSIKGLSHNQMHTLLRRGSTLVQAKHTLCPLCLQ